MDPSWDFKKNGYRTDRRLKTRSQRLLLPCLSETIGAFRRDETLGAPKGGKGKAVGHRGRIGFSQSSERWDESTLILRDGSKDCKGRGCAPSQVGLQEGLQEKLQEGLQEKLQEGLQEKLQEGLQEKSLRKLSGLQHS
ncbi:hypothetical protein PROH_19895 [Prochlorothrix hollandica PCC 9006 = CALU 1027]|uniref:Uncharacterized protein n=1 Tax=Prochlorothrix hollandica PCC 9006 = CALU 1027 TaxID=317619 RepID=A0A0M2PUI0_PROHO|nr:hypothetical protein PROH_19895 [Prochlorothrix hollandica PCC 9006 = CALU 1027]